MSERSPTSWRRALGTSLLAWTAVLVVHALAGYSDQLRRGGSQSFGTILGAFALAYLPWVSFSVVLLRVLTSHAAQLGRPRFVLKVLAASAVLFLIPQAAYQVALAMRSTGAPWSDFFLHWRRWPAVYWLTDTGLFGLTFAIVYAGVMGQESQRAQQRRLRSEAENLNLRLQALRGQLEPHFLFNSLNAISGLVRGEDKSLALSALQQLSALLRYALGASQREWVTLGEELDFTRDYVTLQRLRYGDRLRFHLLGEGEGDRARSVDCPSLLLQPLIENAIRHDLEGHEDSSDIQLTVQLEGTDWRLEVTNSRHPGVAPNPGAGLGLRTLRDRLALLYGDAAELTTRQTADRFTVTLRLPEQRPASSSTLP